MDVGQANFSVANGDGSKGGKCLPIYDPGKITERRKLQEKRGEALGTWCIAPDKTGGKKGQSGVRLAAGENQPEPLYVRWSSSTNDT